MKLVIAVIVLLLLSGLVVSQYDQVGLETNVISADVEELVVEESDRTRIIARSGGTTPATWPTRPEIALATSSQSSVAALFQASQNASRSGQPIRFTLLTLP
jgi:hypothetical protein